MKGAVVSWPVPPLTCVFPDHRDLRQVRTGICSTRSVKNRTGNEQSSCLLWYYTGHCNHTEATVWEGADPDGATGPANASWAGGGRRMAYSPEVIRFCTVAQCGLDELLCSRAEARVILPSSVFPVRYQIFILLCSENMHWEWKEANRAALCFEAELCILFHACSFLKSLNKI